MFWDGGREINWFEGLAGYECERGRGNFGEFIRQLSKIHVRLSIFALHLSVADYPIILIWLGWCSKIKNLTLPTPSTRPSFKRRRPRPPVQPHQPSQWVWKRYSWIARTIGCKYREVPLTVRAWYSRWTSRLPLSSDDVHLYHTKNKNKEKPNSSSWFLNGQGTAVPQPRIKSRSSFLQTQSNLYSSL